MLKRTITEPASQAMSPSGQTTPPRPSPYPSKQALYKAAQRYGAKFGTVPRSAQLIKHVVKTADSVTPVTQSELKKAPREGQHSQKSRTHCLSIPQQQKDTHRLRWQERGSLRDSKDQQGQSPNYQGVLSGALNPFGH